MDTALLTAGLLTAAVLLAMRLLIRDFFSIDICLLLIKSANAKRMCNALAKSTLQDAGGRKMKRLKQLSDEDVPQGRSFSTRIILLVIKN